MKNFYKIFMVLFILFIGLNLYAFKWHLGYDHEDNFINLISIAAGVLGLILVFVLDTWSKLKA